MDEPNDTAGDHELESVDWSLLPEGDKVWRYVESINVRVRDLEEHTELETTVARIDDTLEVLLEIVDSLVRHRGSVTNAAHVDALDLLAEDSAERRPKGREQLLEAARAEMTRRAREAAARR